MLSSQECDKNPKKGYEEHKMFVTHTKGFGKNKKVVKTLIKFRTRKQELVTQNISICDEAYNYMLSTPTSPKLAKSVKGGKRVWDTLSMDERLKHHFDLIAHDLRAVSYSYEVLAD